MSKIDEFISMYEKKCSDEAVEEEILKKETIEKNLAIVEDILGKELWEELKPNANYDYWNSIEPGVDIHISGSKLKMADFTISVADESRLVLFTKDGERRGIYKDLDGIGEVFDKCRRIYEKDRQEKLNNRKERLVRILKNPNYHQEAGMTDQEALNIKAELFILDPDHFDVWNEYIENWMKTRAERSEAIEIEKKLRRKYEQSKKEFEVKFREWYRDYTDCKNKNTELVKEAQEIYDTLGNRQNYILSFSDGEEDNCSIFKVQVIQELVNGYYKVCENGEIKVIKYFHPISLETIELHPDDRRYWMKHIFKFEYENDLFNYELELYHRPGVRVIEDEIKFVACGNFPKSDLGYADCQDIIDKVLDSM